MMSRSLSFITNNRVAIYGGGFDPITLAHENVARMVWAELGVPVWTMPCFGHLFGKKLTPAYHRWAMLLMAAQERGHSFIVPCDWELRNQHSGSMFETLGALSRENPGKMFELVMGMDNANVIHRWHRGEELVATYPCIVVGRGGIKPLTEWYLNPPHHFIPSKMDISATDIRQAVEKGDHEFAERHLRRDVWEYIKDYRLFGYKEPSNE